MEDDDSPLFLGRTLLSSGLGRLCGSLGDAARLGLADHLGLFDNGRGLISCQFEEPRAKSRRGQPTTVVDLVLRALPELALGLAAVFFTLVFLAAGLVVAFVVVFLGAPCLGAVVGVAFAAGFYSNHEHMA